MDKSWNVENGILIFVKFKALFTKNVNSELSDPPGHDDGIEVDGYSGRGIKFHPVSTFGNIFKKFIQILISSLEFYKY